MNTCKYFYLVIALFLLNYGIEPIAADPLGTAWTYQGELKDGGALADGDYDFEMKLFDVDSGGLQQNGTVSLDDVSVVDGGFTVQIDFGANAFNGDARWLEIAVRPGTKTEPGDFVTLTPRQEVMVVPYAMQTRGIFASESGKIGFGTTNPSEDMHVHTPSGDVVLRLTSREVYLLFIRNLIISNELYLIPTRVVALL